MAENTPLDAEVLKKVIEVMLEISNGSWEIATAHQSLLEYHHPHLTPFSPSPAPTPLSPHLISIVKIILVNKPSAAKFPLGRGKILTEDDAAGDPASLGSLCLVVLGGIMEGEKVEGVEEGELRRAVEDEMEFLMEDAFKNEEGVISHRLKHFSLWADFIYMVPPFMALYATTLSLPPYLHQAIFQIRSYRQHLKKPGSGLWRHILYGGEEVGGDRKVDPWAWSTSVGWAAAGILRVWTIIQRSQYADQFKRESDELVSWAKEIMDDVIKYQTEGGMIRTYVDEEHFPEESCGTAILASVAFRFAQLNLSQTYLPFAHRARVAVHRNIDRNTGKLQKVCSIYDERQMREESAEGQAFVVLMEAAWRDWSEGRGRAE